MKSSPTDYHQQQLSAIIPVRYRILLYVSIFLVAVDLIINTFSEFLAPNTFGQLIIFIIQDVCIVLSVTLLIVMVLTTYVAQAGLLCLLLRMFRFSILVAIFYLALCATVQALLLVQRFTDPSFTTSAFQQPQVLALYIIQRTFSVIYYYGMKRAAYRLSDPHFYQSSRWLQNLWNQRQAAATGATMQVANQRVGCQCCAIQ